MNCTLKKAQVLECLHPTYFLDSSVLPGKETAAENQVTAVHSRKYQAFAVEADKDLWVLFLVHSAINPESPNWLVYETGPSEDAETSGHNFANCKIEAKVQASQH